MDTKKIIPNKILDFTEISTCNSVEQLLGFRNHLIETLTILSDSGAGKMVKTNLNKEIEKIDSRIEYLNSKN